MQVDFYQVSQDAAETVVAMLAEKTLAAGQRLLVVAGGAERLEALGRALWSRTARSGEPTFLANGLATHPHAERQPILLAESTEPANAARFIALADGIWREEAADPARFDRAFLIFDAETLEAARTCWRTLGTREGLTRNFWKQDAGRWVKAA